MGGTAEVKDGAALTSRDRGMTRGQQGTSSARELAQASSATCCAAWIGDRAARRPLSWLSSTDRELRRPVPGWTCTMRVWAEPAAPRPSSGGWCEGGGWAGRAVEGREMAGEREAKGSEKGRGGGLHTPVTSLPADGGAEVESESKYKNNNNNNNNTKTMVIFLKVCIWMKE